MDKQEWIEGFMEAIQEGLDVAGAANAKLFCIVDDSELVVHLTISQVSIKAHLATQDDGRSLYDFSPKVSAGVFAEQLCDDLREKMGW